MRRRDFLSSAAAAAALLPTAALAGTLAPSAPQNAAADPHAMPLGLLISPSEGAEETIKRVHDLGLPTCFFSLDAYIGKFTPALATEFKGLLTKYNVTCTTVEVVGPQPLVWDFMQGPSTIGLVPRATRAARIDALKQASDFAKLLGVRQVQTHLRFHPGKSRRPSL
jgi:hypothetical protein